MLTAVKEGTLIRLQHKSIRNVLISEGSNAQPGERAHKKIMKQQKKKKKKKKK